MSTMDKIKNTLHLKDKQEPTSTSAFSNTDETKKGNPLSYHGADYKDTSSAAVPGYGSSHGKDESSDSPGIVDKVKDALHLRKDNHDPSERNTNISHTDLTGRNDTSYLSKPSHKGNSNYPFTGQSGHPAPLTGTSHIGHVGNDSSNSHYTTHTSPGSGSGSHGLHSSADYRIHAQPTHGQGNLFGTHDNQYANRTSDNDPRSHGNLQDDSLSGIYSSVSPPKTVGPHQSDLVNRLDPRVDSNLDNSRALGGNRT